MLVPEVESEIAGTQVAFTMVIFTLGVGECVA
jgi:hypothetical protein